MDEGNGAGLVLWLWHFGVFESGRMNGGWEKLRGWMDWVTDFLRARRVFGAG